MATAKQRLIKTINPTARQVIEVHHQPTIKIGDIAVEMDTTAFADAVNQLAAVMRDIAIGQADIMRAIQAQNAIVEKLIGNQPDIKVAAPVVKMAPRPRSYRVAVQDGDELIEMNIEAILPN